MNLYPLALLCALTSVLATSARAAQWQYRYQGSAATVEIAPLQFGKTWAYSLEIDDGPASTVESQKLLARYNWNDAPPGVGGGASRPFVGTAAVSFGGVDTTNPTYLNQKQLDELRAAGWGVANHSYWHSGNHWDAAHFLKPQDFRRELFWSQLFYAAMGGGGRGATHFVYPSGDYNYGPYLQEFGLRSASRVSGTSPRNALDAKWNPLDLDRNSLDENVWTKQNNALAGLPETPKMGDFIIDFTHGMNGDAASQNHKDWEARLSHLAEGYGAGGDNSLWVAPTEDVVNYRLAAQAAKVEVKPGIITVFLPDDAPASALTLVIGGLNEKTKLAAPDSGTLYRQGQRAWLTTPVIGTPGTELATPHLKRIYSGPVGDLKWDEPVKVAGVRLLQSGPVAADYDFKMEIETPDGQSASLLPDGAKIAEAWGRWLLFPTVPDREAPAARALKVMPDRSLRTMEVWAQVP